MLLIVVNIAVFVVKHLEQFRWTITALAFVSGIMLNSWMALNIYRAVRKRLPNHPLTQDHNQELVLVLGMAAVTISAVVSAIFCYRGLGEEADLPNKLTFLTGAISIAIPIVLSAFFKREVGGDRRGRGDPAELPGQ
ncbi:MAG: hypothetical protein NVSMB29_08340 [Candidatus Dormibacteria bacterium]